MEMETIELPKQLMDSIRAIIEKTGLYADETDFISQAIVKQISKYK
jgi:Arc/MetJ-type ribon-helix-helix transcriptional regulator